MDTDSIFVVICSAFCTALILVRCTYRVFCRCHVHDVCHRHWRKDDLIMALALLPLAARAATILYSNILDPSGSWAPVTDEEADAEGRTQEEMMNERVLARKLWLPTRICYALFVWCMKACLLAFYSRFISSLPWGRKILVASWCVLALTFVAVVAATVAECRPLSRYWTLTPSGERATCAEALGNLLTMGLLNILTDLWLIALPFPMLRKVRLSKKEKYSLGVIFSVGAFVVIITVIRLPLILTDSLAQNTRTLWASIEILCACIVANAAFFYAVLQDLQRPHQGFTRRPTLVVANSLLLQRLPSSPTIDPKTLFSKSSRSRTEHVELADDEQHIVG